MQGRKRAPVSESLNLKKLDTPLCHLLANQTHIRSVTSTFTEDDAWPPVAPFVRSKFPILWFIYNTHIRTHTVHNGTISIPATCFGDYVAIIRQYTTARYLKHVKIWHTFVSHRYSQPCLCDDRQSQSRPVTCCMRSKSISKVSAQFAAAYIHLKLVLIHTVCPCTS